MILGGLEEGVLKWSGYRRIRCSDITIPDFTGEENWDAGDRIHTYQMIDDPLKDEEVDTECCTLHYME